MVICLERGADFHMAQLMPLPLTVSCFSKIQVGLTFLVPAHLGGPVQRADKRVCVHTYVKADMNPCLELNEWRMTENSFRVVIVAVWNERALSSVVCLFHATSSQTVHFRAMVSIEHQ